MGYFHASKLLKSAFLSSLTRKYVLWKGFYHDFSTKKASALSADDNSRPPPRGSAPWTPAGGASPMTPEVPSPSLTIYPGAVPGCAWYPDCILARSNSTSLIADSCSSSGGWRWGDCDQWRHALGGLSYPNTHQNAPVPKSRGGGGQFLQNICTGMLKVDFRMLTICVLYLCTEKKNTRSLYLTCNCMTINQPISIPFLLKWWPIRGYHFLPNRGAMKKLEGHIIFHEK